MSDRLIISAPIDLAARLAALVAAEESHLHRVDSNNPPLPPCWLLASDNRTWVPWMGDFEIDWHEWHANVRWWYDYQESTPTEWPPSSHSA